MPQCFIQECSPELEPFRESVLTKRAYCIFKREIEINNLQRFLYTSLFLLGFEGTSVSGGGICSSSTCKPLLGTSWSLVSATCGSEGGCGTELAEGVEGSRVEGMRRFSAIRLPCQWELVLMVTNKDEEDEEDGSEPEGSRWASRNPACMCDHLAWGSFWVEFKFAHLDIGCTWKKREWNNSHKYEAEWGMQYLPYLVYCYHCIPGNWGYCYPCTPCQGEATALKLRKQVRAHVKESQKISNR